MLVTLSNTPCLILDNHHSLLQSKFHLGELNLNLPHRNYLAKSLIQCVQLRLIFLLNLYSVKFNQFIKLFTNVGNYTTDN